MAKIGEFATLPQPLFDGIVTLLTTNPGLSQAQAINGLVGLAKASNAAAASSKSVDIVALTMLCIDMQTKKNILAAAPPGSPDFLPGGAFDDLVTDFSALEGLYKAP